MNIHRDIAEAQESFAKVDNLALIPTMGALHEGHCALINTAAQNHSNVAVSIFVNPLQFGQNEDFDKYPRKETEDLRLAKLAGANFAFIPDHSNFTKSINTTVKVKKVTQFYEGAHRPGHFDGVATIVLKLFNVVQPKTAYFGLKDLQQCAVIQQLVKDLNVPVKLQFIETIREESGLAKSSRNEYMTPEQRATAAGIYKTLIQLKSAGKSGPELFEKAKYEAVLSLNELGMELEYLDLVDPTTMLQTTPDNEQARIVIAGKLFGIRLIDNILLKNST